MDGTGVANARSLREVGVDGDVGWPAVGDSATRIPRRIRQVRIRYLAKRMRTDEDAVAEECNTTNSARTLPGTFRLATVEMWVTRCVRRGEGHDLAEADVDRVQTSDGMYAARDIRDGKSRLGACRRSERERRARRWSKRMGDEVSGWGCSERENASRARALRGRNNGGYVEITAGQAASGTSRSRQGGRGSGQDLSRRRRGERSWTCLLCRQPGPNSAYLDVLTSEARSGAQRS
ncbi:hypothetical protein EXIGLDRAFT_500566 [Exidia glandulosa HHB12029]|uniref:Uncharacterized protein n=1 Tax=Exidia glandulosa HHB12029 TaxID=1314781 RepID=A0A165JDL3_EXIGL|nr:hypothetical protein EXIGLDRAFT_500566 [Exidia glandulosa HHB12029]